VLRKGEKHKGVSGALRGGGKEKNELQVRLVEGRWHFRIGEGGKKKIQRFNRKERDSEIGVRNFADYEIKKLVFHLK